MREDIRNKIYYKVPLLRPDMVEKQVIIGNDLDSLVSACIYLRFNPRAKLFGIYQNFNSVYTGGAVIDPVKTIWLDLDMVKDGWHSVGHHVLSEYKEGKYNPNEEYKTTTASYINKYPLSTAILLTELYNCEVNMDLVWACDSVNSIAVAYKDNVEWWLQKPLFDKGLNVEYYKQLDNTVINQKLADIHDEYNKRINSIDRVKAFALYRKDVNKVNTNILALNFNFASAEQVLDILNYVNDILCLPRLQEERIMLENLTRIDWHAYSTTNDEHFTSALNCDKLISYAWIFKEQLNYTLSEKVIM